MEEVLEQTYEDRPYEYPLVRVFEIGDDGKIRRLRVYLDRLSGWPRKFVGGCHAASGSGWF